MKELETERLLLHPMKESDDSEVFAYSHSQQVGPNAGWKPHESIEETRELMKTVFLDVDGVFGIRRKSDGRLIGSVGLIPDPKRENDRARMLGYSIGDEYWGNGYMTEAAKAMLYYGFSRMELALISAYCFPGNIRSKRVIEKCGFRWEGCLTQAEVRFDGKVMDNDCYCLLRKEYDSIKKGV